MSFVTSLSFAQESGLGLQSAAHSSPPPIDFLKEGLSTMVDPWLVAGLLQADQDSALPRHLSTASGAVSLPELRSDATPSAARSATPESSFLGKALPAPPPPPHVNTSSMRPLAVFTVESHGAFTLQTYLYHMDVQRTPGLFACHKQRHPRLVWKRVTPPSFFSGDLDKRPRSSASV